jgi:sugar lactone lactonase YvrE
LNSKGTSQKVGGKTANELGIHDMSGNVAEWTWSVPQYLGDYQSIHGGSWYDRYYDTGDQWTVKSSYKDFPMSTSGALGFRLALNDKVVPRPPKAIPTPRPTPKPVLIVTRYNDSRSFSSGSGGDYGLVSDKSGNLHFAGGNDGTIRKVLPSGNVTLFAGRDPINGNTVKAVFQWIHDISVDGLDNLYIPETTVDYSHKVTKISPSGAVSTFASGNSTSGWNGTGPGADYPRAIALDSGGNIFIGERYRVRKITPGGTVSVVAGSGSSGSADGIGTAANFNEIQGLAVDKSGNLYVADTGNHKIRKISPTGVVSTLAGADTSGSVDGAGATARFNSPQGIAVDSSGNVYVADTANNKIRKISTAGVVATLAGTGLPGATNGPTHEAGFYQPTGVTIGKKGEIYIHDSGNGQIRKISPPAK